MKVSDYKKTAFALSSGYVKSLYIISAILMVLCTILPAIQIIAKESYIQLSVLAIMTYILGELSISAMCPVFEGTEKRRSLSLNDLRTVSVLYQLPAGRETMVRAYISFDRFFSTMLFLSFILQGAAFIFSPDGIFYQIFILAIQLIVFSAVIMMSIFWKNGRPKKADSVRTVIYMAIIITQLFIKLFAEEDETAEISALSAVLGAAAVIFGILGIVIMNCVYKGMAAACTNYSVSGEPITNERNDADV